MSARVYYRPVTNTWKSTSGQSTFWQILDIAFGYNARERLTADCIPVLRGIAAAGHPAASDLILAIQKHGEIELKCES